MKQLSLIALVVFVAACALTAPSTADLTGTWVGTISTPDRGSGTVTLTIIGGPELPPRTSGEKLAGQWSLSFADTSKNVSGRVDGDFIDSSIGIGLYAQPCSYGLEGALTGPSSMSGEVTIGNCPATQTTGSFAVSRAVPR